MATSPTALPVFAGEFRHAVDSKNRITIPARWRQGESDEFFLVPDQSNSFLLVMPQEEFEKVNETVLNNPAISAQDKRVFVRRFYSLAQNCAIDKQGRLLLPEDHCRQVGLKGEVVLVGSLRRFEIWNPNLWAKFQKDASDTYAKVADLVGL